MPTPIDKSVMDGKDSVVLEDVSNDDYHATNWAISSSMVKTIVQQTPAHFWAKYLDPEREPQAHKEAFSLGSLFHMLVLEPNLNPEKFFIVYEDDPELGINRRTKDGKEAWAKLVAKSEQTGRALIGRTSWSDAVAMAEKARKAPLVDRMFSGGKAETTLLWKDPGTGLYLKARPDYTRLDLNMVADLKSCQDASPDDVARTVYKFRYDIQQAHYTAGYRACYGSDPEAFVFCFMEKSTPYCPAAYIIDAETMALSVKQWQAGLEKLASAFEQDRWPGYPEDIQVVGAPPWAKRMMREDIEND